MPIREEIIQCALCRAVLDAPPGHDFDRDTYVFMCRRCGQYSATFEFLTDIQQYGRVPELSMHCRQSYEVVRPAALLSTNWEGLARSHRSTSVNQNLDKLLRFIESKSKWPGFPVPINNDLDWPVIDVPNSNAFAFFIGSALSLAYLMPEAADHYLLTTKGWEYLTSAAAVGVVGRVFVAMSFHADLMPAFDLGIKAALETDCRLSAFRVDRDAFTDKICDRILAEIRRCQFAVADFTLHRGGVYFEAGFAMALGRPVICTCRDTDFDNLHFDTRQYPHIKWTAPEDLRTQLADRVRALNLAAI